MNRVGKALRDKIVKCERKEGNETIKERINEEGESIEENNVGVQERKELEEKNESGNGTEGKIYTPKKCNTILLFEDFKMRNVRTGRKKEMIGKNERKKKKMMSQETGQGRRTKEEKSIRNRKERKYNNKS